MLRCSIQSIFMTILLLPGLVSAQLDDANKNVDWQKRTIAATGFGAPNRNLSQDRWRMSAIEAARIQALAKLLETTKGLSVTSETVVESFTVSNQTIKTKVEGIIRNFQVISTKDLPDGTVEVVVAIPIDGDLSNLFIPESVVPRPAIEVPDTTKTKQPDQLYTGLIVDARGLQVRPAMLPKIVNEEGQEVYGTGYVSRDYAVSQGIAGYSKDLKKASNDERVKDKPIIIKGIKASGSRNTDVVISNEDAKKLRSLASNLNFMQQCKVIIALD